MMVSPIIRVIVCCSSIKFEAVWTWVGNFEQKMLFFCHSCRWTAFAWPSKSSSSKKWQTRRWEIHFICICLYSLFFFIKRYKYWNNKLPKKNGQSECRKAVVYLSELHQTFPSISAVQQYHPKPFHRALRFQLPVSFICCLSLDYASLTGHWIFCGMV